jgi:hypothetical protein
MIRDTSKYGPFTRANRGFKPSLKLLVASILGIEIQQAAHSSVEDAWMAMLLYKSHRIEWERKINRQYKQLTEEEKSAKESEQKDLMKVMLEKKKEIQREKARMLMENPTLKKPMSYEQKKKMKYIMRRNFKKRK